MAVTKEQKAQMPEVGKAPPSEEERVKALLNANYLAPELVDPQNWINSKSLTLAQLQKEG